MVPIVQAISEKKIFPIGSYVKTMSADGGHLGWTSGPTDTILKGDHLRIIPPKFGPNQPSSFREKIFHCFSHRVLLEDARKFAGYLQLQNESDRHWKHPSVFVFTF